MPPASPTTAASTTTPKRSSRARTAASPPLIPKMNVPARLRTRISVGSKPRGTSTVRQHVRRRATVSPPVSAAALLFDQTRLMYRPDHDGWFERGRRGAVRLVGRGTPAALGAAAAAVFW